MSWVVRWDLRLGHKALWTLAPVPARMRLPLGAELASSSAGAAGGSSAGLPLEAELASVSSGTTCGTEAGAGGSSVALGAAESPTFGTAAKVMAPPLCLTMFCTSGAFDFAGGGGGVTPASSMVISRESTQGGHGDFK